MNTTIFKSFEVIGKTKDEAISAASPLNLMVDATQAYKKWAKENAVTPETQKEWMKEYMKKKKFDRAGLGAYIVLQSAVVDTRERPYKENKPKYDVHTHTFKRMYVLRDKTTGTEIGCEKTSTAARQFAKEWVIENHKSVEIFVEAKVEEKNSLYTTIEYTPSKGTQSCKLLVFGYYGVD